LNKTKINYFPFRPLFITTFSHITNLKTLCSDRCSYKMCLNELGKEILFTYRACSTYLLPISIQTFFVMYHKQIS